MDPPEDCLEKVCLRSVRFPDRLSSSIVADAAPSQANIWLKRKGHPATGSLFFKGE